MVTFGKWIFYFFIPFIFASYGYAAEAKDLSQPYGSFSVGYGAFHDGFQGTGSTTMGRIAIGNLWNLNESLFLGGEFGIQNSNQMLLFNNVAKEFGYTSTPPVYLTIKPPVDILAALKLHFENPAFIQIKAGAVYLRTMTDFIDIRSQSDVLPEVQGGVGFDLNRCSRIIFSYQHFFGKKPTLVNINSATGTAKINNIPSWSAGMISFETDL